MSNTYSIAHLAASAYLGGKGMGKVSSSFACDEGTADMVTTDGETTVLVKVAAKRKRCDEKPPEFNAGKLQRIAMCYLVEHSEVTKLRFDVLEVLIGSNATATVCAVEGAYAWER